MQRVNEPVRVGAIFAPGGSIRPVWFDWRRKKHEVREITYTWHERQGATTTIHFTVTAGGALYELVFDTERQRWMLAGLEAETA
jgi:hypothetical protein